MLGFRIGPPYLEYLTIKKQLKAISEDPEARSGQRRDVELAFSKRSQIEDISSVQPKDIAISKEGDGIVLSVEYTVCRPVVSNIRACMDFHASSH
ncbi:hypothetical protein D3C83_99620 [compost metagenome]